MGKSLKAALLSAFVFPGLGHFYLKQRIPGTLLAGAALAALVPVTASAVHTAQQLSAAILRGEIQPDVTAITALLARQPAGANSLPLNIAYAVLVIAWLIGVIDSYRTGRTPAGKHDEGEEN